MPRPEGETLQHTKTQFGFLAGSCAAFDTGHTAEAQRIATHLRILLYNKGTNKALLGQYVVPDKLRLFDSAGAYDLDSYSPFSLVGVHMDVTPGSLSMLFRTSRTSATPNDTSRPSGPRFGH